MLVKMYKQSLLSGIVQRVRGSASAVSQLAEGLPYTNDVVKSIQILA